MNNPDNTRDLSDEYDFSNAERGKFYNPNAQFHLPVYLDADILIFFAAKAKAKGVELNTLINEQLKKDIELSERS